MSQKLPVDGFKWEKSYQNLMSASQKTVIRDIFLKQMLNIQTKLFNGLPLSLHSDLPLLPERNKIKKCNTFVCNIYAKESYVVHVRVQLTLIALNHKLILKKVHKVIQFNQEAWLKTYIDMNTKLRTEAKLIFTRISVSE